MTDPGRAPAPTAPGNFNLPNLITVVRILLAPLFFWLLLADAGADGVLRWIAAAIFISFKLTLLAYAIAGVYLVVQKKRAETGDRRMSDFDRMDMVSKRKPTTHAMVNDLDETDRRLMAIDHHINTQNEELAREIEALRREEK